MTFFKYIKNILNDQFDDRDSVGTFVAMISSILSTGAILAVVVAIASSSLGPIWAFLTIFGVMIGMVVVLFFVYNFVYWLINRKDM